MNGSRFERFFGAIPAMQHGSAFSISVKAMVLGPATGAWADAPELEMTAAAIPAAASTPTAASRPLAILANL